MDFLSEHGLPVALTPLLYKRLHDSAIDALCENPYLLCDPYYDVDFKLADGLAMELGLSLLSDDARGRGHSVYADLQPEQRPHVHPGGEAVVRGVPCC